MCRLYLVDFEIERQKDEIATDERAQAEEKVFPQPLQPQYRLEDVAGERGRGIARDVHFGTVEQENCNNSAMLRLPMRIVSISVPFFSGLWIGRDGPPKPLPTFASVRSIDFGAEWELIMNSGPLCEAACAGTLGSVCWPPAAAAAASVGFRLAMVWVAIETVVNGMPRSAMKSAG